MIHYTLKFSIISLLFLTSVLLVLRSPEIAQPLNPIMNGFFEECERKPRPCWHGIVAGVTGLDAAIQQFADRTYFVSLRVNPSLGHNEYVISDRQNAANCVTTLVPVENSSTILRLTCPGLRLGDMMVAFGTPDAAYSGLLYYHNGLALLAHQLSAYSEVETVYLIVSSAPPECSAAWSGFAPWWRYQQWRRQMPAC